MKTWLILYLFSVSPSGEIVDGHWIEQAHRSSTSCSVALDRAIRDWERLGLSKPGTGIVGRCSDRPLSSREV